MSTHKLPLNYLDEEPTASVERDAAVLHSMSAPEPLRWTVIRMKLRNCACYPIYLNFETPLTEAAVLETIAQWVERGDHDWREFRYFDVWPTEHCEPIPNPIPDR